MMAGLTLALPILRTTLRWYVILFMLMSAWGAWVLDSVGIGLGASAGAGALLAVSVALGLNLRRSRTRAIARTLPSFLKNAQYAVAVVLVCLIAIVGALDGWRPESLLAIFAAAAFGLGLGLSLPTAWIFPVPLIVLLWLAVEDLDPAMIWSSAWSPAAATVWLLFTYLLYSLTRRWDRFWSDTLSESKRSAKAIGRQPHRLGHLLSTWPALAQVAMGGILGVTLTVASIGDDVFARISAIRQVDVTGYLIMFAGIGVLTMLVELLSNGRQMLRKLAVLPGWGRDRLFVHAELSCWRVGLWLMLVLIVALLATGLWAGNALWGLWLQGLLICWVVLVVGIYTGLWLSCLPGPMVRIIGLLVTLFPLLIIVLSAVFEGQDLSEARSALAGPMVLAASLVLAWWLRRQARSAWASISFSRES